MADDPIRRLLVAAKLLYANSEGCAVNHYSDDFAIHGLPGWLTDCAADIQAAEQALATPAPSPAGGDVRELLGSPDGWREQREALQMWTASGFLAGEPVKDEAWHKRELYSDLCRLVSWLHSAEDAARAALSPSTSAAEPVAWMDDGSTRAGSHDTAYRVVTADTKAAMPKAAAEAYRTPLYTRPAPAEPAARQWRWQFNETGWSRWEMGEPTEYVLSTGFPVERRLLYATPPAPAAVDGQRVKALVMPEEPDDIITDAIRKAWRETRTSGVSGMTIDAQWRAEYARELAVYRAIRACLATDKEGA